MSKIPVEKLLYDFYLKKNSMNTGSSKNFAIRDVVSFINEAWYRIAENNIQLAEQDRRYEDNIRLLKVKHKKLNLTKVDEDYWVAKYPSNLYKRLNQSAVISHERCVDCQKEIPLRIVQSDDLNDARRDPYRKANFGWEQLIAEQGSNGLYVYTDGQLDLDSVTVDYYKKPTGVTADHLITCNKPISQLDGILEANSVFFEVDNSSIATKVVDVAVLISDAATRSPQQFQTDFNKIVSIDKIA